jgi:flagellin-like hook-associated protein FlgL
MAVVVGLSQGVLSNLLALQNTTSQINTVQNQLATGKKVNSALDNPSSFFLANSFQTSINALNSVLDKISLGQRTLDAANTGISKLSDLLQSTQGTLNQALSSAATAAVVTGNQTAVSGVTITSSTLLSAIGFAATDVITVSDGTANTVTFTTSATQTVQSLLNAINGSATSKAKAEINGDGRLLLEAAGATYSLSITSNTTNGVALGNLGFNSVATNGTVNNTASATGVANSTRTALAAQFNTLRSQIDQLAVDSAFNGTSLLNSGSLTVNTNETGTSKIVLTGNNDSSTGLGLTSTFSANSFQDSFEINAAISAVSTALTSLQNQASTYASQLSVVQARQDFTSQQVNTLTNGINNLTQADSNLVGAQLLALQTRQTLSSTALSLATQSDQNVLRLFR